MKTPRFIVISGLIGVGKTTFTDSLSSYLGYRPVYEPVDENPYLDDFYKNPKRWGYPMQEHLKSMRFRSHMASVWAIKSSSVRGVVADRSIYEDSIFAEINRDLGNITDREYRTYLDGYSDMALFLAEPDVIIYLNASPETCKRRIMLRSRKQEIESMMDDEQRGIPLDYLRRLERGYNEWIDDMSSRMPIIRVQWEDYKPVDRVWGSVIEKMIERSRFNRSLGA